MDNTKMIINNIYDLYLECHSSYIEYYIKGYNYSNKGLKGLAKRLANKLFVKPPTINNDEYKNAFENGKEKIETNHVMIKQLYCWCCK